MRQKYFKMKTAYIYKVLQFLVYRFFLILIMTKILKNRNTKFIHNHTSNNETTCNDFNIFFSFRRYKF